MKTPLLPALVILLFTATGAGAAAVMTPPPSPEKPRPWLILDGALWDISDDGLPFRLSLALPARPDPLGRLLPASDQRWTVTAGYAQVRGRPFVDTRGAQVGDSGGGDSVMIGVGRAWRWALPEFTEIGGWRPHATIEAGVSYAHISLPDDGTHFNFPVVTGFEWSRAGADDSPWLFGVQWFHLSNANLIEGNRGYDGIVWRLGRRWDW